MDNLFIPIMLIAVPALFFFMRWLRTRLYGDSEVRALIDPDVESDPENEDSTSTVEEAAVAEEVNGDAETPEPVENLDTVALEDAQTASPPTALDESAEIIASVEQAFVPPDFLYVEYVRATNSKKSIKQLHIDVAFDLSFCLDGGLPYMREASDIMEHSDSIEYVANAILLYCDGSRHPTAIYARSKAYAALGPEYKDKALREAIKLLTKHPNFEAYQLHFKDLYRGDSDPKLSMYNARFHVLILLESSMREQGMYKQALMWLWQIIDLYPTMTDLWERAAFYAHLLEGSQGANQVISRARELPQYRNALDYGTRFKQDINGIAMQYIDDVHA